MKAMKRIFTCLLIGTLVTGCNMKEEGRETDQHGEVNNRNSGGINIGNSLGNPNLNLTNTSTNNIKHNHSGLHIENEAEDKVENLPEVNQANIIVSNRNAYVAVEMDEDFHGEISPFVEDQIAQQVREANPNIQNVYISSKRDFVTQMRQYRENLQNGKSTDGFTKMVQRFFLNHTR
ncbi:YhcN/YlaJ family sporulation lipoprotein [Bacillus sp. OK048]|uniref:YhcN/YlaJ family sporulation lipoprotein n=1 Tax=Bacillus sp. OK048 TaxID=1882761 RepID=UPI00158790F6|nr:YhcN/YlaJ family sporulation lipoprotein [Bacillus sp. OK048]